MSSQEAASSSARVTGELSNVFGATHDVGTEHIDIDATAHPAEHTVNVAAAISELEKKSNAEDTAVDKGDNSDDLREEVIDEQAEVGTTAEGKPEASVGTAGW